MTESIKLKSTRASKILNILSNEYPDAGCHLDYNNPFELLISTLLAAQCTDERVNTVMVPLFKKYKTPNDFLNLKPAELEHELRSINFYRNKTKSVLNCCAALVNEHNSEVPKTMGELTKLAGVGRKTANVVLGNCFGEPAIMTDTHLNRVSQRLGLTDNDKPEKIEMDLKEIIPDKMQVQYSHVIGQHGRSVCKAKKPLCNECVVCELCPSCNNFN
ncbi:MAG TPA: endonuclease III [Ignavibacteria bacterium]|nr:endonuclease III [Bacteroidota bacterium]HRF66282.1 endonuclease III [Ignavibacteria bacterium]HRJ05083.1 endonuclease III [Ignavibacteria bacterium]